jgi:hypothetical protein
LEHELADRTFVRNQPMPNSAKSSAFRLERRWQELNSCAAPIP